MNEDTEPQIPPELQPRQSDVAYDLAEALSSIVSIRARIPDDAFTATILGTERAGHGVLIAESGLIVTIGYLVTEAHELWLVTNDGQARPGHVVGYDYESGFGLVQALGALDVPMMELGTAAMLEPGQEVVVAGAGGAAAALKARVAGKREFAGYWEYVLDEAVFTTPAHPNWGGTAVISQGGHLCAIGSLYLDEVVPDMPTLDGNMNVPIDLLIPIMGELERCGRTLKPARPWLGVFVSEAADRLFIAGLYEDAPAAQADLRAGDIVLAVAGRPIEGLANLFRAVWALGSAGTEITLTLEREGRIFDARIRSADRRDFWRAPDLH